jgi:hypothetical protein
MVLHGDETLHVGWSLPNVGLTGTEVDAAAKAVSRHVKQSTKMVPRATRGHNVRNISLLKGEIQLLQIEPFNAVLHSESLSPVSRMPVQNAEPVAYQNHFKMSVIRLRRTGLQPPPPDTGTPLPVFRTMQS